MLTVKVIRVPGTVKEVVLEDGSTVAQALEIAGISPAEHEAVTVGGETAGLSDPLANEARIILAKGAKGNAN